LLLGSLSKGLFIFCPILVLGLFGWGKFARRHPWEAALCGVLIIENLLLTGAWHSWIGGSSYGPRLLVLTIPLWLLPAAFWLDDRPSPRKWTVAGIFMLISFVVQIPGVLVKGQQVEQIMDSVLTPEERTKAIPYYPATCRILWHKLTVSHPTEIYRVSEFGIPGDREFDLSEYRTYQGLNVWTEHVARHFKNPAIRWLPVIGLFLIGYLVYRMFGSQFGSTIRNA
jgi:hypothetical protein